METISRPSKGASVSRGICLSVVFVCLSFLMGGCEEQSPAGLPVVKMKIGSENFSIEVARSKDEQEKGLMKRDSMPADHGMIFVFDKEEVHRFWMKDTRFPLDIIFLNSKGRVVSIHQMQAYDLAETSSDFPAQYAVELNLEVATKSGVKVGDVLDIPPPAVSKN